MNILYFAICLIVFEINSRSAVASDRLECKRRIFDENSFVCVCNATYCDTIEQVDQEQTDQFFQQFVTSRTEHRLAKFKNPFEVPNKDLI